MKGPVALWMAFFFGVTRGFPEYIVSVDLSNGWRQHIVWSKKNGDELKKIVTERFSSSTVFLSLLFSSELSILYSPSDPGKEIRENLEERDTSSPAYWTGVFISFAIFFSVTALVANFTAMSVFNSLSKENAAIVLRSTIGLYTAQLPSRLVTGAIYLFFAVVVMTWIIIMKDLLALALSILSGCLLIHIVNTFSSMGRVIMDSGAMSSIPILDPEEEEKLTPDELSELLIKRVVLAKKAQVPVNLQYKVDYQETLRDVQEGNVEWPLDRAELDRRASIYKLKKSHRKAKRHLDYRASDIDYGSSDKDNDKKGQHRGESAAEKVFDFVTGAVHSGAGSGKKIVNSVASKASSAASKAADTLAGGKNRSPDLPNLLAASEVSATTMPRVAEEVKSESSHSSRVEEIEVEEIEVADLDRIASEDKEIDDGF